MELGGKLRGTQDLADRAIQKPCSMKRIDVPLDDAGFPAALEEIANQVHGLEEGVPEEPLGNGNSPVAFAADDDGDIRLLNPKIGLFDGELQQRLPEPVCSLLRVFRREQLPSHIEFASAVGLDAGRVKAFLSGKMIAHHREVHACRFGNVADRGSVVTSLREEACRRVQKGSARVASGARSGAGRQGGFHDA